MGETSGSALDALDTTPVTATGVRRADEVCPAVDARRFLHAGPPIALADIVGPVRGAVLGALVFEGQADDVRDAERILARRQIELLPCHDAGGVGAMAGVVTPSMPVVVVGSGNGVTSFAPLNEGLGQALRFGSNDDAVLSRLVWMRDVAAPLLDAAIDDVGGLDIIGLQSEGLLAAMSATTGTWHPQPQSSRCLRRASHDGRGSPPRRRPCRSTWRPIRISS